MANRNALHQLVEELPETEVGRAHHVLAALLEAAQEEHPVIRSLRTAPLDDEPEHPDERKAVEEALQEMREGARGLSTEELERELGLR